MRLRRTVHIPARVVLSGPPIVGRGRPSFRIPSRKWGLHGAGGERHPGHGNAAVWRPALLVGRTAFPALGTSDRHSGTSFTCSKNPCQLQRRAVRRRCQPIVWVPRIDGVEIVDGDTVWRFDTAFLRSNWTCIWGRGCLGILPEPAEHLGQGCCSIGADLDGEDEAMTISALAATIDPARFQHHAEAAAGGVFRDDTRTSHPGGRRRLHLPQPAGLPRRRRVRPPPRGGPRRRVADRTGSRRCAGSCRSGSTGSRARATPRWPPCGAGPARTGARRARPWRGAAPRATGPTSATTPVVESLAEELEGIVGPTVYVELRRRLGE